MFCQQPSEFQAGISGGPDDSNIQHFVNRKKDKPIPYKLQEKCSIALYLYSVREK
jgi:hypothetical protein